MNDESKPVGRHPRLVFSYVKLEVIRDGSNVDVWVNDTSEVIHKAKTYFWWRNTFFIFRLI